MVWAYRHEACDILGVSGPGLLLLQRDGLLPPDCRSCGRIRWRRDELVARRDELRQYLTTKYHKRPDLLSVDHLR